MTKLIIGIDPGANTGLGVWSPHAKKFLFLKKLPFWSAIDKVTDLNEEYVIDVVIEDPTQNKPVFPNKLKDVDSVLQAMRMAQNIGSNKRDAQLWFDFFDYMKIPYRKRRPTRKSHTKLTAEAFNKITGWSGPSNEHSRDAGMLVYGMK